MIDDERQERTTLRDGLVQVIDRETAHLVPADVSDDLRKAVCDLLDEEDES